MENTEQISPEAPEYVLTISKWIVRYAKGDISFEEYHAHLDNWYEKNRDAWKESDLATLFLTCCISS